MYDLQKRRPTRQIHVGKVAIGGGSTQASASGETVRANLGGVLALVAETSHGSSTSAKGGDPMSHGSAERSASFRAEHYR